MKCVRIYAESVENKDEYPMSFDLLLDAEGKVTGDFYTYGLSGRPEQDGQCYPFALVADGSMDFGAAYENEQERWWRTDLREHKIEQGAAFKIWEQDQEFAYTIVKIDVLAE
jgi:hypothetical protein